MKVYISQYRNHWISPYTLLKKYVYRREIDYDDPTVEKWANFLTPLSLFLQKLLDFFHPPIHYVKINKKDTWNMDQTLALIILPMLIQLKETKHGAPFVEDEDVPDELKSTAAPLDEKSKLDGNHFKRWDYVMDEMIFAFRHKADSSWELAFASEEFYDAEGIRLVYNRMDNGFRLFGKYYQNLWD